MALNRVFRTKTLRIAVGSGRKSGDPAVIGSVIRGVCKTDADADGIATIDLPTESVVYRLPVLASTDDGSPISPSAVALGDKLYLNLTSRVVSKDSSGTTTYGIALGTPNEAGGYASGTQVASGATADCDVLLLPNS